MLIGSRLYLELLLPVNLMCTAEHFPKNSPDALAWEWMCGLPPVQHLQAHWVATATLHPVQLGVMLAAGSLGKGPRGLSLAPRHPYKR